MATVKKIRLFSLFGQFAVLEFRMRCVTFIDFDAVYFFDGLLVFPFWIKHQLSSKDQAALCFICQFVIYVLFANLSSSILPASVASWILVLVCTAFTIYWNRLSFMKMIAQNWTLCKHWWFVTDDDSIHNGIWQVLCASILFTMCFIVELSLSLSVEWIGQHSYCVLNSIHLYFYNNFW